MLSAAPHSMNALSCRLCTMLIVFARATASACTSCDTETGRLVRAGIFGDDFWSTLIAVASPFPLLLAAIACYHFGLPKSWSKT